VPTGKVKWFDPAKGFGFLSQEDGPDVYVHSDALPEGVTTLKNGARVEFGIAQGRSNVAHGDHIRAFEVDVKIAGCMRHPQVAVVNVLVTNSYRPVIAKGLHRECGLGASLLIALLSRNPVIRRHPLLGTRLGDDLGALPRELLVIGGLVQVVVGIKEGLDLAGGGQTLQRSHHGVARSEGSAVYQYEAFPRG